MRRLIKNSLQFEDLTKRENEDEFFALEDKLKALKRSA
jgi:hypothetical protein